MIWSNQKIKYANLLAALLLGTASFLIAVYFINFKIKTVSQRLINAKNQLIALENEGKLTTDLINENQSVEKEVNVIENALPDQDKLVNLVENLESLAAENNLNFSLKIMEKPPVDLKKEKNVLLCDLFLSGKEGDIFNFLEGLNRLPYFSIIYQLQKDNRDPQETKIEIKLGFYTNANL